jgi:recombination protein RecT
MTTAEQTQLQTAAKAEVARPQPQTPVNAFRGVLEKMKPQIQLALPRHVSPDRMLRIVLTTVQRTPKLLDCTRESLLGCIVQCAQLGLEPDGLLGHAYLIPFFNSKQSRMECQLIVGYKGLLKLARQSGEIASIAARVVHEKDLFEFEYGLQEKLRHIPSMDEDPGPLLYAYAIFRLKDGAVHFDVMSYREIEAIRKRSKSGTSGPWTTDFEEMAKKTVLRRASKMSPASIEDRMARAITLDEKADAGLPQNIDEETDEGAPAGNGEALTDLTGDVATEPPKEFVVSTLKQRKEIVRLCAQVKIAEEDAARWAGKAAIDELSREEADYVGKRLAEQARDEAAGAIT